MCIFYYTNKFLAHTDYLQKCHVIPVSKFETYYHVVLEMYQIFDIGRYYELLFFKLINCLSFMARFG